MYSCYCVGNYHEQLLYPHREDARVGHRIRYILALGVKVERASSMAFASGDLSLAFQPVH